MSMLKIKSFKNALLFFMMVIPLGFVLVSASTADLPQGMLDALKTGNSLQLSKYFNTSIELAIPGKEDIYSSKQAELILKDFFTKHVPSNFVVLHKGGKEGSQYAIGNLTTSSGNFRVTLWVKLKDNKPFIHQLRFEEENAD